MPEGDTIRRIADRLRPALVGAELRRFTARRLTGPAPAPGTTVIAVEAVGKHLLITFADGIVLQTHLRMTGSWHLFRPGERWTRPPHRASVELVTDSWVAVCFSAPVVRTHRTGHGAATVTDPAGLPAVAHLGPDLATPEPDLDEVLARLACVDPTRPLPDVLLDQTVAAGIGNVYRNELLWRHRYGPATVLGALDDDARRRLYADAHRLLRANLGSGARVTEPTAPGGLAVYRRRGRPCLRCGTAVVQGMRGDPPRTTYWCPRCQPDRAAVGPDVGADPPR